MSEHNKRTIDMYDSGGALEYLQHQEIDPETEKWNRLFNYVEKQINKDKNKRIVELGSGCGQLALMLQSAGYDITATDIVEVFLNEQKRIGINKIEKYNFLLDNYGDISKSKADLIISWRNPHLDMADMKKLFEVSYNALTDNGLLIINFQNADIYPNAKVLANGTKYEYKIIEDKKTKEKRFYGYYNEEDIDLLRKDLFEIVEHHTEGGKEKKNWHVFTFRKVKKEKT